MLSEALMAIFPNSTPFLATLPCSCGVRKYINIYRPKLAWLSSSLSFDAKSFVCVAHPALFDLHGSIPVIEKVINNG